jgi:hypothetical protein
VARKAALVWLSALLSVAGLLVVGLSRPAEAGSNEGHKLAIHVKSHPTSCSSGFPNFSSCAQIVFAYAGGGEVDVIPVFFELREYLALEFGLDWPWTWGSLSWVRCKGDISIGTIVRPGDGTAVDWTTCQTGWSVAPGFGWLTASGSGVVRAVRNPATGDYGVIDCTEDTPVYDYPFGDPYSAGIGGAAGDDPCQMKGGSESSWGGIKSMFR